MADIDKRDWGGYFGDRYAAFGYADEQEPSGDVYCRFDAANIIFCSADGAGEHPPAAGRGHCGGKSEGGGFWAAGIGDAEKFPENRRGMGTEGDQLPRSLGAQRDEPSDILPEAEGTTGRAAVKTAAQPMISGR